MAELQKRKYFIKDTSVNGIGEDLFNYADISKVLERILESNKPPYNIAIIGKWGLGKSSLINLVKNKVKNDNSYLVIPEDINAWKCEKESLRRVFLKLLWQGISGEKLKSFHEIQRAFSDLINDTIKPERKIIKSKWWRVCGKIMCKYGLPILGIILFTVVGFSVYKLIQANTTGVAVDSLFWWNVILSYCKNIATTLMLPVLIVILTALHSEYRKKEPKRFEFNFPLETADDYELFLETSIAEMLKNNPDMKIVTVIDDLDRLSIDKIAEALDSIKAFVNLPNCIFIVPFDDEIIKSALKKQRKTQFGKNCDVIESELILDKLFQFKIYLPPLFKI
jgi:predicted KAP-like P-loop ATPase